jgi:hypothetical protein
VWCVVPRVLLSIAILLFSSATLYSPARAVNPPIGIKQLGELILKLSEPEGYFDSDNFVSNEAAYLRVLPALRRMGVKGGAYLGVGPDQNYSYMAETLPEIAFIIDIRRQNLLQHIYYKALFQLSANRIEYMERLFGRQLRRHRNPERATIGELLRLTDEAAVRPDFQKLKLAEAENLIRSWDLGLSSGDLTSISYIARAFMQGGPDMKFTSYNRPPHSHHPSYRGLLMETDSQGMQTNYLAEEERFRAIKRLHHANRIVPLVGDFGGEGAVHRTAIELRRRGVEVSCLYISNVEFYLFRGDHWSNYVTNLRDLPWSLNGCIVRSYANVWQPHPAQIPGYYMSTLVQPAKSFLANEAGGVNVTYWDMVTRDNLAR